MRPLDLRAGRGRRSRFDLRSVGEAVAPWPAPGALADADMAGGRYWRQDLGLCTLDDLLYEDAVNIGNFNPATDIVPGVGLFAGTADTNGEAPATYPRMAQGLVDLFIAAGGAMVVMHTSPDYTGTFAADDYMDFALSFSGNDGWSANFYASMKLPSSAITVLHYPEGLPGPPYDTNLVASIGNKIAASLDMASNTWLVSNGGETIPGWVAAPPVDFSDFWLGTVSIGPTKYSAGDSVLSPSIPRLTWYPPAADQAAVNAKAAA